MKDLLPFGFFLLAVLSGCPQLFADDRLAFTYASFRADDFDSYQTDLIFYKNKGFKRISIVPTYFYEHLNTIEDSYTPSPAKIKEVIQYAIKNGMAIIYKPHIDPIKYTAYDIYSTDNESWRVNTSWRGLFDIAPLKGGATSYYNIVVLPALQIFEEVIEENKEAAIDIRFEIGTELMNSVVSHSDQWLKMAKMVKKHLNQHGLSPSVRMSHNFTHHFQIPEDYILRMEPKKRKCLKRYIETLDEVAISQYMNLQVFIDRSDGSKSKAQLVAEGLKYYIEQFRNEILGRLVQVRNSQTVPIQIGEYAIGVGGLKHPNYWEGRPVDKEAQLIGFEGLLLFINDFADGINDSNHPLNTTIWTVGPVYDIFGFSHSKNEHLEVANKIQFFLKDK